MVRLLALNYTENAGGQFRVAGSGAQPSIEVVLGWVLITNLPAQSIRGVPRRSRRPTPPQTAIMSSAKAK
jgi:hypothetical protein